MNGHGSLFRHRGIPSYIRANNGPEVSAGAVNEWLSRLDVGPLFIQPGSPWEKVTLRVSTASSATNCWIGRSSTRRRRRTF